MKDPIPLSKKEKEHTLRCMHILRANAKMIYEAKAAEYVANTDESKVGSLKHEAGHAMARVELYTMAIEELEKVTAIGSRRL